uniref:C3H1-type domain-containing protein n=1 Tax=Alexandrium andersonii TaxID=327968 RepID=A0A6U6WK10_9DINO
MAGASSSWQRPPSASAAAANDAQHIIYGSLQEGISSSLTGSSGENMRCVAESVAEFRPSDSTGTDASPGRALSPHSTGRTPKSRGKKVEEPSFSLASVEEQAKPDHEEAKPDPNYSVGALNHGRGTCKPCAWRWKPTGCNKGAGCDFCHACPRGRFEALRKEKDIQIRDAKWTARGDPRAPKKMQL